MYLEIIRRTILIMEYIGKCYSSRLSKYHKETYDIINALEF